MRINYPKLLEESMLVLVKKVLTIIQNEGLLGEHYFYLSFLTYHPKVILSSRMKARYPEEITIVLQHQFENLIAEAEGFSLRLSFDNIKEEIFIPYAALTAFVDPSEKFSLQFKHTLEQEEIILGKLEKLNYKEELNSKEQTIEEDNKAKDQSNIINIIDLRQIRKKPKL